MSNLTITPKRSRSLFYERDFSGSDVQAVIKFGPSLGIRTKSANTIRQNTLNNHTVLATFGKVALGEDAKPLAELYQWIKAHIKSEDRISTLPELFHKVEDDNKRKMYYLQMLKKADFNITDFHILTDGDQEKVVFESTTKSDSFELPDDTQSAGTLRYLSDLRFLYDMILQPQICLLDELGEHLLFDLLLYYINVLMYNTEGSQLIFTSQETELLAEDFINEHRQLVWFVEKSHDTAASEYRRADDFGLHKNLSLYNSYRIGRLGSKPELGSPFIQ